MFSDPEINWLSSQSTGTILNINARLRHVLFLWQELECHKGSYTTEQAKVGAKEFFTEFTSLKTDYPQLLTYFNEILIAIEGFEEMFDIR